MSLHLVTFSSLQSIFEFDTNLSFTLNIHVINSVAYCQSFALADLPPTRARSAAEPVATRHLQRNDGL